MELVLESCTPVCK